MELGEECSACHPFTTTSNWGVHQSNSWCLDFGSQQRLLSSSESCFDLCDGLHPVVAIQITIQPAINKPTEGEINFRTAREFIIFHTLKTIKRFGT